MKFAVHAGRAKVVSPDSTSMLDLERASGGRLPSDPNSCFARWSEVVALANTTTNFDEPCVATELDAPSPHARQVFGIGLNYRHHAEESNMPIPTAPLTFPKFPSSINSPFGDVVIDVPAGDFEAELVVVVGSGGRNIEASRAWDAIAGICVGQDISDRALQFASQPPQFGLGKSRLGYSPFGPWLTSPDAVPNRDALQLSCLLNGEEMQSTNTNDLIFSVTDLVTYLSSIVELLPGDVIFTGTPGGIGATRKPPRFLAPGDVLTTSLAGVATITNTCVGPK